MLNTERSIVNGSLLRRFVNQKVNIMVKIEDMDANGTTLLGKTTDNQSIHVCLSEPASSPVSGWVEVIGVPTGSDRINCEEVSCKQKTNFVHLRNKESEKASGNVHCLFYFKVILFEQQEGDEAFDTDGYDMLVQFLNNSDTVYKTG